MSSTSLRAQQAILLGKNSPAPYSGILAPTGYIKDLEMRAVKSDFYKAELTKNVDCLPELSNFEPPPIVYKSFFLGIGVGAALTLIIVMLTPK